MVFYIRKMINYSYYFHPMKIIFFFKTVIFFHFNNVSDQNIIFDIYEWGKEDIPNEIIKLFPCINPFMEDREIYNFHYINSSVGLEGIVITKK